MTGLIIIYVNMRYVQFSGTCLVKFYSVSELWLVMDSNDNVGSWYRHACVLKLNWLFVNVILFVHIYTLILAVKS